MKKLLLIVLCFNGCFPFAIEGSASIAVGENQSVSRSNNMQIRHAVVNQMDSNEPASAVSNDPLPQALGYRDGSMVLTPQIKVVR